MRSVYAAIIALFVTAQALTLALQAHAQSEYDSVGWWTISLNDSGACVLNAQYEGNAFLVFGFLGVYEGIIYVDWDWKLPNDISYALELNFTNGTRVPVVGSTYVDEGYSGIQIPFTDERLITLFRYSDDMEIISRESGKSVAHILLKDSNAAYASWRLCVEEYHYTEENPFGSGQPSSKTNPFERGS